MTREEEIIQELLEAKYYIRNEGFKSYSYPVLAIEKAIKYLTEIKDKQ